MDPVAANVFLASASAMLVAGAAYLITRPRRKNRRVWCRPWIKRRTEGRDMLTMLHRELISEDPQSFSNFTRMSPEIFGHLLSLIRDDIYKMDTHLREAISPEKRLAVTLRFMATGESFRSLMYSTRINETTIGFIVKDVCQSISTRLQTYIQVPRTTEEWSEIADNFMSRWNFPNCLGAIDGKHIRITPPPGSGSHFYNYKGFHSIVLLALVDSNYKFLYFDLGVNGRVSDGGVFRQSSLNRAMQRNELNFPPHRPIPSVDGVMPFVFLADDAFPLTPRIMKPYPERHLDEAKNCFNYRLSRARRVVENAFGILSNRFRMFLTTFLIVPDKVEIVTEAALALHNFIITTEGPQLTNEDEDCPLPSLLPQSAGNRSSRSALQIRDNFKNYFVSNPLE